MSFGGWRDWLLVLIGAPLFLSILVAAVLYLLGNRRRGAGPVFLSLPEAVIVAIAAIAAALIWHRVRRWWDGS